MTRSRTPPHLLSLSSLLCAAVATPACGAAGDTVAARCEAASVTAAPPPPRRGVLLEDLTWVEAAARLGPDTVVVLPLGAAAKEHGPHLRLKNDFLLAEHFKARVLAEADVVVAPTLNYHYYPPFLEYPGSTSLRLETARDLVVDVVKSLASYGPRRFYVLNTGIITIRALEPAATALAADGILLRYTNLSKALDGLPKGLVQQPRGTHADEVETSVMLVIAPETVDMTKAVRDVNPRREGARGLSRTPDGPGVYSPTGVWGDATLATKEKGVVAVEAIAAQIARDLEAVRAAPLPTASPAASGSNGG